MITRIQTGFLSGNLFDGWSEDEMAQIEAGPSVHLFAELLEKEVRRWWPDVADIRVHFEDASGIIPASCSTRAWTDNDDLRAEDETVEAIDQIQADLYESQAWQVYVHD
jgi:hypothetical protein